MVRAHYVARDPDRGIDEVTPVVERAMALYEGAAAPETPAYAPADHLADILTILGHEPKLRTHDDLHRLREHNPCE